MGNYYACLHTAKAFDKYLLKVYMLETGNKFFVLPFHSKFPQDLSQELR